MASVTVPFAYEPKYDAGIAEATARIASAEADRRRLEDRVRRDVEQAWLRVRTAKLRHDLFASTHIPQAEQALTVTEAAYQSGGVDFLSLLDTLRAVERVHLEHVDSAAETADGVGRARARRGWRRSRTNPPTPRGAAEGRRHG